MEGKLSRIENITHICLWTLACLYSLYKLVGAQTGNYD